MSRGSGPKTGQFRDDDVFRDLAERLAAGVRTLRDARGWSQEEAAGRCRLAPRVLQMVESGTANSTLITVARLSRGFDVDVADLFLREDRRR